MFIVRANSVDSIGVSQEMDVGVMTTGGPTWKAFFDKGRYDPEFHEL